jgi:hypothetical protein
LLRSFRFRSATTTAVAAATSWLSTKSTFPISSSPLIAVTVESAGLPATTTPFLFSSPSRSVLVTTARFHSENATEQDEQTEAELLIALYIMLQQAAKKKLSENDYKLCVSAASAAKKQSTSEAPTTNDNIHEYHFGQLLYENAKKDQNALTVILLNLLIDTKTCDAGTAVTISQAAVPKLLESTSEIVKLFEESRKKKIGV